jgi:TolA-binding protein/ASC-1-like (ASCH) protein
MKRKGFITAAGVLLLFAMMLPASLLAQDESRFGADSATCVEKLSLYREFYKQWKGSRYQNTAVNDAFGPWRWVFNNCPRAMESVYTDGNKMVEFRIKKAKDDAVKEGLIDTLLLTYDNRIKYFPNHYKTGKPQAGYILGRKGGDLYKYRPSDMKGVYNTLKKSIELEGNKSKVDVLIYYFRNVIRMAEAGEIDNTEIVDTYDQLSGIIDYNLKKYANNAKKLAQYETAKNNIELTFEPYATCEDLVGIYQKKFDESPDDVELLGKITKQLDKTGCTDTELFFAATEKLHKLDPTPQSAYLMARMLLKKEDYNTAADYLIESVDLFEDAEKKADAEYLLAQVYFSQKNYPEARKHARAALKLRPTDGNPLILIGDMYAASASKCGSNDLEKSAGFWAAVDKYAQAKNIDASIADMANKRIATYKKHFPKTETIFFHGKKTGDSYEIGCWINETTKVRASDE